MNLFKQSSPLWRTKVTDQSVSESDDDMQESEEDSEEQSEKEDKVNHIESALKGPQELLNSISIFLSQIKSLNSQDFEKDKSKIS